MLRICSSRAEGLDDGGEGFKQEVKEATLAQLKEQSTSATDYVSEILLGETTRRHDVLWL